MKTKPKPKPIEHPPKTDALPTLQCGIVSRRHDRRCVVSALDTLINGREWTGNVQEVAAECSRQGHGHVSDYMIRQVLRDYGEALRRGQYHVTHRQLVGAGR